MAVVTACSPSGDSAVVHFEALIDGELIADSSPSDPVPLRDGEQLELMVLMTNATSIPIDVGSVELDGRMLGLSFVRVRTALDETVQPGEERLITFPIDLYGVDRQAHGLLRGRIALYGPGGESLASQPLTLDGRGRVASVTSLLALALAAIGGIGLATAAKRFIGGGLPGERRLRGLQLVPTGAVFGLALSATSSVVRIWPLPAPLWVLLTGLVSLAFYALGVYLPPSRSTVRFDQIDLTRVAEESMTMPRSM
jgi:hypothetical protein